MTYPPQPFVPRLYALCIWREARGEGVEGMRAVAWVIWNRARKWGKTLYQVIMQPNQFTSMTVDPHPHDPEPDDFEMAEATGIVGDILTGRDTIDPTDGACYYANLAIADSSWFTTHVVDNIHEHPKTTVIGRHTFFL